MCCCLPLSFFCCLRYDAKHATLLLFVVVVVAGLPLAATIVESGWIGTQGRVGSCLCRPCTTIQLVDKDRHTHTRKGDRGRTGAIAI